MYCLLKGASPNENGTFSVTVTLHRSPQTSRIYIYMPYMAVFCSIPLQSEPHRILQTTYNVVHFNVTHMIVCKNLWPVTARLVPRLSPRPSLVPARAKNGGAPGTHCLRMRLISPRCGDSGLFSDSSVSCDVRVRTRYSKLVRII